jgi:hypothetical protein
VIKTNEPTNFSKPLQQKILSSLLYSRLLALPSLDDHGKLGAAIIPFYIPVLFISLILAVRHRGFSRKAGWIFLFLFSISEYFVLSHDHLNFIRALLQPEF